MKNSSKPRRSKEEILLEKMQKEQNKKEREEKREAKKVEQERKRMLRLQPPTEEEIVRKYAKRVIMNQSYHGRVDAEQFKGMAKKDTVNKGIWMDTDFFFSVVFQSQDQKVEFLKKLNQAEITEEISEGRVIQIVNGLELAKHLGIELTIYEHREEYPLADMSVAPMVLDTETFKEEE